MLAVPVKYFVVDVNSMLHEQFAAVGSAGSDISLILQSGDIFRRILYSLQI